MASFNTSSKGAEEPEPEPEPEPGEAPPYDPRAFQPPHPHDRDGPKKCGKGGGESKSKSKSKPGAGSKTKGRCGNCDAEGAALRACKQCGATAYCDEKCQQVSGARWLSIGLGGVELGGGRA